METFAITFHNLCSLRTLLRDIYLHTNIKDYFLLYKEVIQTLYEMNHCLPQTREQMNPTFTRTYKIQEHRMRIISYENKIPF
jgi:hypothetical protein